MKNKDQGPGSLRQYLRTALPEPPDEVMERAFALLEPPPPRLRHGAAFSRGRLMIDTGGGLKAGLRGPAGSRHKVWRAPGVDVEIEIRGPSPGARAVLVGQVLPRRRPRRRPDSGDVWLIHGRRSHFWAPLGPSGEFTLPAPAGPGWAILLAWGRTLLRLDSR
jgi:hypothetical protein